VSLSTIGVFQALPGSRNTVPQSVRMSVDLRHPHADGLDCMEAALRTAAVRIASDLDLAIEIAPVWSCPPVAFPEACVRAVRDAAARLGLVARDIVSGAGHDAVYISRVAPTGMIFIPCLGGVSHNEAEEITPAHAQAGADVLLHAVLAFDAQA